MPWSNASGMPTQRSAGTLVYSLGGVSHCCTCGWNFWWSSSPINEPIASITLSGAWQDQGWGNQAGMIRVEVGSELFTQGVAPHYKAGFSYTWTLAAPAPSGSRI
eukprot:9227461-Pyramimonas_sp.AAC.1